MPRVADAAGAGCPSRAARDIDGMPAEGEEGAKEGAMTRFEIRDPSLPREARPAPSFEESLYERMRETPWWLASMVFHGVLALLLTAFIRPQPYTPPADASVTVELPAQDIAMDEPDPPPRVLERPPIEERPPELPVETLREAKIDDPRESEDPETDFPEGDPLFDSESPFRGPGANGAIGVGGDAGGPFGTRGGGHDRMRGEASGTHGAVSAGLRWLADHQSPDGRWDCDGFEARCRRNKCGGAGGPLHDVGVSGLALLAFLAEGETHRSATYGRVVREGLKYLKSVQDPEGCFGPRTDSHFTYSHAIAAMAMAEAYGLTASPLFKTSAQAGIDFVHRSQNPYRAWRYGVRPGDDDTSVTGWMVMALKSANVAGLRVDPGAFRGAVTWLDKVTDPEYGRAGYTMRGNGPARPTDLQDRFPQDRSESLTAVAVLTRIFCGAAKDDEAVRRGTDLMLRCLPVHDRAAGTIDHYYWYYGTLAMFQVGGEPWKRWNEAMKSAVLGSQNGDAADDRLGSWDPDDPWGPEGGRVYSTAVNTMSLQIYYRYGRLLGMR